MNIILDLDQTLVSAEMSDSFDFKKYKKKSNLFDFEDMDGYYIVFARPHLQEFLDYLFANFNVSVWTAASKDYALFIINKFILTKPERKLDFIFFSYHCSLSKKEDKGLKGLCMLWDTFKIQRYNSTNTLIIDDNIDVKKIQTCNCYMIKPFEFTEDGSENDDELEKLISKLEKIKKAEIPEDACLVDLL